jgi:hypothetical protein
MTAPNYFGYIGEQGGKLRPIITMTIPMEQASPCLARMQDGRANPYGPGERPSQASARPVPQDA